MQTITAYIVAISKGEATPGDGRSTSRSSPSGILLFVVTLIINIVALRFVRRFRTVYQ